MDIRPKVTEDRRGGFKPKGKLDGRQKTDLRIKRHQTLRKEKRGNLLGAKRRFIPPMAGKHRCADAMTKRDADINGTPIMAPRDVQSLRYTFEIYVPKLSDPNASNEDRLQALSILANADRGTFKSRQLIEAGLRPTIIQHIAPFVKTGDPKLQQFVSYAWQILTNLANIQGGGDWCTPMFEHGIMHAARIHMQNNNDPAIVSSIMWTVCNTIGYNGKLARIFLSGNTNALGDANVKCSDTDPHKLPGISAILRVFGKSYKEGHKEIIGVCAWLIQNLLGCRPTLPWALIEPLWPCLVSTLQIPFEYDDKPIESLLSDALWAAHYMSRRGSILAETLRENKHLFHAIVRLVHVDYPHFHWPLMELLSTLSESEDRGVIHDMILYNQPPQAEKNLFLARVRDIMCSNQADNVRELAMLFLANALACNLDLVPVYLNDGIVDSVCLRLTRSTFRPSVVYLVALLHVLVVQWGKQTDWDKRDQVMRHLVEKTAFMQAISTHVQAMNEECVYRILEIVQASLQWRRQSPNMQRMDATVCDVSGLFEDDYLFDALAKLQTYGASRVEDLAAAIVDEFDPSAHVEDMERSGGGVVGGGFDAFASSMDHDNNDDGFGGGGENLYSF